MLAVTPNGGVLYRWRALPLRENMGGATNRPTAKYVFEQVSAALRKEASSEPWEDAALDSDPELDSRGMPWVLFLPLLVSNGKFIDVKTFGQEVGGPSVAVRMKEAAFRVPLFLGAWALGFWLLPKVWVGAALCAWAGWMTPKILRVNRQFQPALTEDFEPLS
ncbi:MAG: hypothetical protein AB8G23_21745 [Myxococcota bacterium]